ncbi:MAG: acyltransferase [Oscillospiraceae bacterium]|jgi:peptidoglycan/LPS O-acetylase OafA/YrhL|nr:acyltransferase [Oscillospiraceae bacterium]
MKRNALMDTLRLLVSFFVVLLHAPLPGALGEAAKPILRCAVPFFFMVSGYWLADNDMARVKARLDKQARRMFLLLAASCAAFFAMHIAYSAFVERTGFAAPFQTLFDYRAAASFLAFNNTDLFWPGGSAHLWFLAGLLYALLLLRLALERLPLRRLYWSIPVLLAMAAPLAVLAARNIEAVQDRDMITRNFLFTGIPCVLLGMWLRQNGRKLKRLPDWAAAALPAACAALCLLERHTLLRNPFELARIPLAASLALLGARFPAMSAKTFLPRWGERYSLTVYIVHYPIVSALKWLAQRGLPAQALAWGGAVIAFALALVFAMAWDWGKRKIMPRQFLHSAFSFLI